MRMESPYDGKAVQEWDTITSKLIENFPLTEDEIIDTVLEAWSKLITTRIGGELEVCKVGIPAQAAGVFLHVLIADILSKQHPDQWRREKTKADKDLVYIPDDTYSTEIKTTTGSKIAGNRSYGKQSAKRKKDSKSRSGYYLAIKVDKIESDVANPQVKQIRFGWLDLSDWKSQSAATGQQASLDKDAWNHKMKILYSASKNRLKTETV